MVSIRLLFVVVGVLTGACYIPPPADVASSSPGEAAPAPAVVVDRVAEIARYGEALAAEDVQGCLALVDTELQGDCTTNTAILRAGRGEITQAQQACDGLAAGTWRDECFFQIVDAARLNGGQAAAICQQAGEFAEHCLSHVAARAVEEGVLRYAGVGNEQLIQQQVFSTLRKFYEPQRARVMAQDMVSRWLANRYPNETFSQKFCGNLDFESCAHVYEVLVRGPSGLIDANAAWRRGCGQALHAAMAEQYQLPPWEPEMDSIVQHAWGLLCRM